MSERQRERKQSFLCHPTSYLSCSAQLLHVGKNLVSGGESLEEQGIQRGRQSEGCSRANRRVVRVITSVRVNQRVEYDQSWTGMSLNSSHCQMHLRRGVFAFGAGISRGTCRMSDIRLLAIVNFRKRYFGSIFVRVWPCGPNLWEQSFVVFCELA